MKMHFLFIKSTAIVRNTDLETLVKQEVQIRISSSLNFKAATHSEMLVPFQTLGKCRTSKGTTIVPTGIQCRSQSVGV
jgi:hypothetical protein